MNFTTTLTSKNQLTLPKSVRDRLGLKNGAKIDIFPTLDGGFIGRPKLKSNILEFAGNLIHLDDGRSWKEIREEAEKLAAKEWVSQKRPYDKDRSR
ncbi:hypothetical protein A3F00_00785 [Candidatus Daviesbacteria bacterium RIFCSPHIGHO2_12_FULL_37_11]|uniref:SpoVT-AbrB domain-containing protein n=1 Tax=Candidatus Daviesbacteria bacterium RIFCSPHIGHO2_12_FULL_37_11 TaxID=1797777 RepID=A0A1F5KD02_9BACT|nr:MAG: hypothetical protein A2111_00260 [Candidatus Daviesbacteria bacterium GWA1_38_6]OGE18060.1 MAG: hypothetical protein A2769_00130 [Candidatus Daviesbacteria bacterium RIFCSPHIGHO2_01_FULL_37_27]OGE38670.1 MAG: hypothetical protein A3F00_00785 [Candidatus Daviesbacteria bacterium RIFCSPHIGHO2_12_FULL_37_11]OGE45943.1 MAG: hypothetical protein A3B39_00755 [Candidatus Daviesbacteria bacterium RIFCSPLOWO2_01_FULL_37_10]